MRVKVGNTWYDGAVEPIAVELSASDRLHIAAMRPEATRYGVMPDESFRTHEAARAWLADELEIPE